MSVIGKLLGIPQIFVSDEEGYLLDSFSGLTTEAGERVTPTSSMMLSAYYACQRNISEDIGKLPMFVYERLGDEGKRKAVEHWGYRLLHEKPHPYISPMSFKETLTAWAMGWGGGFAEIIEDGGGLPAALYPIHPNRVGMKRTKDALNYIVRLDAVGAEVAVIPAKRMLHIHGFGPDGVGGYSLSVLGKEAIALGLAAQKFGARFFRQGARMSGALKHPELLGDKAYKRIREGFGKHYQGGENVGHPLILEEGMEWQQLSIPPEEAQFLQTRQFQIEELARWFRMPPHKIQHLLRAHFNNITHQSMEYVTDTLLPWAVRWEQEVKLKLFADEPDIFAETLFTGLLRGDPKERAEYYQKRFNTGSLTINEIKRLETENPIGPEGDLHWVQVNMMPVEQMVAGEKPEKPADKAAKQAPATDEDQLRKTQAPVFQDAMKRVMTKTRKATERAAKRHEGSRQGFMSWATNFFAEHAEYVVEALMPAATAYAMLLLPDIETQQLVALLESFAVYHTEAESMGVIAAYDEPDGITRWLGKDIDECARGHAEIVMSRIEEKINAISE